MTAGGGRRTWLLFDGDCGSCSTVAAWITKRDGARRLRVTAYQEAPSPPMTPELWAACAEAVHVITPRGRTLRGGDAMIFALGAIGWRGPARLLWLPPLRAIIGYGYGIVARRRGCASDACEARSLE